MHTLLQDLRYALRTLRKTPGFAAAALLALALGIGANATIFSIVNGLLLRPLPYHDPQRLVYVDETSPQVGLEFMSVASPDYLEWRKQNRVFEDMAAYTDETFNLTGVDRPERILGARASAGLFSTLGVKPVLGRTFLEPEDQRGADRVVILSHGLWQRRFGADSSLLGKKITLHGQAYTVIGIMPPDFRFPVLAELWLPLAADPRDGAGNYFLKVVARLKPGVTLQQARAEMDTIARRLAQADPAEKGNVGVLVLPLRDFLVRNSRAAALISFGAVAFVLLIACSNLANLLLSRAVARQREISIRTALGASRWRLVRQLLTESVALALLGGGLGLLLGRWGRQLLVSSIPVDLPAWMNFSIDGRVLAFVLGVSVLTGVAFGLAPALQISRPEFLRVTGSARRRVSLLSALVVSEVALTLVLLIGAGLMMKGFLRLQAVDPGIRPDNLLMLRIALPEGDYRTGPQRVAFFEQAAERIRALPGVESAAAIIYPPLMGSHWGMGFSPEGHPPLPGGHNPVASHNVVTPEYFRTVGVALERGRLFTEQDRAEGAPPVAIVNATLARQYWPNGDAVGKRLKYGSLASKNPWFTIVGVVGDVKHYGLDAPVRTTIYRPLRQFPVPNMTLVVRSNTDPSSLTGAVRAEIAGLNSNLPIYNIRTMRRALSDSMWQTRLYSWLFTIFAGIAVILAAFGVYGVIAYSVGQRTHEIGIRMALGAQSSDVLGLVLRYGLRLSVIGITIGLAAGLAVTRVMSGLLFGVSPRDPLTFSAVALLLCVIALLACYVPARRAARVDPMIALRHD